MNFIQLQFFISVAEQLNFTRAAKLNYVTQSAISMQISLLEAELGTQLLTRNTRSVKLTPQGKAFYSDAKRILALTASSAQRVKNISAGLEGRIELGFSGVTESPFLGDAVRMFCAENNGIYLSVSYDDKPEQLMKELKDGVYDLVICNPWESDLDEDVAWEKLVHWPTFIVMNADHPKAGLKKLRAEDLENECLITMSKGLGQDKPDNPDAQFGMYNEFKNCTILEVDSPQTAQLYIEAGFGISILPPLAVSIFDKKLVYIELESTNDKSPFTAVVWLKQNINPALPPFIKCITACAKEFLKSRE